MHDAHRPRSDSPRACYLRRRFAVAAAVLALSAVACGGSSSDGDAASTSTSAGADASSPAPPGASDGDFGTFTYGADVTYDAVSRSCDRGSAEPGGASDVVTFELLDGATGNAVRLDLATQNGSDVGVELTHAASGDRIGSASVEATEAADGRTAARGRFDDGTDFRFSLALADACEG